VYDVDYGVSGLPYVAHYTRLIFLSFFGVERDMNRWIGIKFERGITFLDWNKPPRTI
jgi:hypothetical protein